MRFGWKAASGLAALGRHRVETGIDCWAMKAGFHARSVRARCDAAANGAARPRWNLSALRRRAGAVHSSSGAGLGRTIAHPYAPTRGIGHSLRDREPNPFRCTKRDSCKRLSGVR